jgi:hypothetical protein
VHILALGFEKLGILLWGRDDRAVDGDVGWNRISRRRVDVESFKLGAGVYGLIVAVDEDLSS